VNSLPSSSCQGECKQGGARGACCGHNCEARCERQCKDQPEPVAQPAQCQTTCTNACSGSCTAQANTECQITCQDTTYVQCETELVDVCQTSCEDKGGAIFCDGQFVNAANAQSCSAELMTKLKINVAVDAVANAAGTAIDATKDTASCTKENVGCSVSAAGNGDNGLSGLSLFGGVAAVLVTARRRKKKI
jgi:MYXO-CTERM domain-containing protein